MNTTVHWVEDWIKKKINNIYYVVKDEDVAYISLHVPYLMQEKENTNTFVCCTYTWHLIVYGMFRWERKRVYKVQSETTNPSCIRIALRHIRVRFWIPVTRAARRTLASSWKQRDATQRDAMRRDTSVWRRISAARRTR